MIAPRGLRAALPLVAGLFVLSLFANSASAFCGFYVAKADSELFNDASKVVMTRHDGKTVITMVNDYRGDPSEFAMVIPVPDVLERGQIHVTETAIVDHLDAYTAPRLVEYFDPDPCRRYELRTAQAVQESAVPTSAERSADALGVTIEAQYVVGEYDIVILSAEQSAGLATWLADNGYRLPEGVKPVLEHYLANGMKFFLAKVNLEERTRLGTEFLRPLQIAFESPGFMLPIRLGMVNADGPQELFIMTLTRGGRVETQNYRTVRMPSDLDVPIFVREEFDDFYRAMFDRQVIREKGRAVFLEYAWDMNWCDPCAADPLSYEELRELGVFWLEEPPRPQGGLTRQPPIMARDVFVTRLHLRYDETTFPEDLRLVETSDRSNFQGRYILRHPWTGRPQCQAAESYFRELPRRFEREAQTLARLTDWPIAQIRRKMEAGGQSMKAPNGGGDEKWWEKIWPDNG